MVSGGDLHTEGLEEYVQNMFRYKKDRTVDVRKCISKNPFDAFLDMAKVCNEKGLEKESLPQWAKKVIGRIWSQVLEDVEARSVFTKSIIGGSRTSEGRGGSTFTFVCEHCNLFPAEDYL